MNRNTGKPEIIDGEAPEGLIEITRDDAATTRR